MNELNIQDMLATLWVDATPDIVDFYDDETGEWMRATADGVSRLAVEDAPEVSI